MRDKHVPAIYIATDKINTKKEKDRLQRLLSRIHSDNIIRLPSDKIYQHLLEKGHFKRKHKTGQMKFHNPIMIFSGFDWNHEVNNPLKGRRFVPYKQGEFSFADFRDKEQLLKEKGVHCNSGFEIHSAFGCFNSCTYCHVGKTYTVMLDIEKFIDNLAVLMSNNPQQKLYKYDNQCDVPDLEPEYGAINKMVEFFSTTDKYLMLYTKSNNLDYLPGADKHKGHTIVCWTLSSDDVSRNYEIGASSLEQRIESARKCKEKGYQVRFRFSPIIPVKGWKESYRKMIKKMFSKVRPEVICLEMLCHMNRKQQKELFPDLELPVKWMPNEYELFSAGKRKQVYEFLIKEISKYDTLVKIAPCLETGKLWRKLRKWLPEKPDNFFCCCGENCV